MVEAQVVERVLVGFQADVFEAVGYAGMTRCGFAVFPAFGIDHLGDAGLENGVKIIAHFDEDVFALAVIFSVQVDDRVTRSAGAGEVVENYAVSGIRYEKNASDKLYRFRITECIFESHKGGH